MNQPLVTIILPAYNGGKWIKEAIKSALAQIFSDFELIVIDDCSKDNTKEIVLGMAKDDKRIIYIKNDTNMGLARTLNLGLAAAKGKYAARLDQDDEWIDKDKLKKQVEFLEENPDHVLIGTGVIMIDNSGAEISRFLMPETDAQIRAKLLRANCFVHTSVVFRVKSAQDIGGYSAEKMSEDHDLWLRLGHVGKFANLQEYCVQYLFHPAGLNSQNKILRLKQNLMFAREHKDVYPNYPRAVLVGYAKMMFYPIFKALSTRLQGLFLKLHKKL
jgi:glycosyltransferase involved in cell wall biosynthesis